MILTVDEKAPPPYSRRPGSVRSALSSSRTGAGGHGHGHSHRYGGGLSLNLLPPHILLQVIYWTCPEGTPGEARRMMLWWMCDSLRYVSRNLWIATMHILRSSYLPLYTQHVLRPFSTDAFPSTMPTAAPPAVVPDDVNATPTIFSTHRETSILDLFIIIRARADMKSDETDLYLDSDDERYRDMFNYMQPRARLEDLVLKYGLRYDLISLPSSASLSPTPRTSTSPSPYPSPSPSYTSMPVPLPSSSSSTSTSPSTPAPARTTGPQIPKTPFSALSITYTNRSVSLCSTPCQGRRVVLVETDKTRGESLESIARRLVGEWWRIEKERADVSKRAPILGERIREREREEAQKSLRKSSAGGSGGFGQRFWGSARR